MIEDIAQKVQDRLVKEQKVMLDPATIMLIITLVSSIISAIQKCKAKPEEAILVAHYPTHREEKLLKRQIRKELGWVKYWKEGQQYYEAVKATGKDLTVQDFKQSYGQLKTMEFRK
jgi:hypothetical protein